MLRKVRELIPHPVVNYGKHLPEAIVANFKYGFSGRKLRVIGVTGTDGKTTTVNMIYQILKDAGEKVSMISTINAVVAGKKYDTGFHVTSPKSSDLQKFLKLALDSGDELIVLEVSSHALNQFRVWGINFEIGVITNITHDHLDYHKTFENYFLAKAGLIRNSKWVVLNYDDPNYKRLCKMVSGRILSFGLTTKADLSPANFELKLKLPGDYNLLNALAAVEVGYILGVPYQQMKQSLESFQNLEGRMEKIPNKKGLNIVIDFASTPNSLENALKTLRLQTKGKLISVFGSASERDTQKRPLMGRVSFRLADLTILTNEDPRFEDPLKIIEEIAAGGDFYEDTLYKEPNREKAIKLALTLAKKGDTVGIFGKGHEQSMSVKGKEMPYSDREVVESIIQNGQV